MPPSLPIFLCFGVGLFAIGTVVGSFLNVCIYRIPWQKSLVWPGSRCPSCYQAIAARDNVPILGWLALRGSCRSCRAPISVRYPLVETLTGLLLLGVFLIDIVYGPRTMWGEIPLESLWSVLYHSVLVALLVAATFIDFDLTIIPDQITVTGMVFALGMGALLPGIRIAPGASATHWGGFWVGVTGLLVGGGLTWFIRLAGSMALRREAMGFGDVTLMAMIGAFLGWQAAVLTFFTAPFYGIAHAAWKLLIFLGKRLSGARLSSADREIPFGPYLSLATVVLLFSWPWLWPGWGANYFATLRDVFWFLAGQLAAQ